MVNRKLRDAGIGPIPGYIIFLSGFAGLSFYLFYRTDFAAYIYVFIALGVTAGLSERRRNEFLLLCFGDKKVRKIRIMENLLVTLPFLLFLCYKQLFLFAMALVILSVFFAFGNSRTITPVSMPTPFYKKPFEFIVGFRSTFLVLLAAYTLAVIAIAVDNFNLGAFTLLLVFATTLCYYIQPEHEYYVWVHKYSPQRFLWNKIKTAIAFSSILCLPVVLALAVFYTGHTGTLLIFYAAGCAFLVTVVLAKYSAYPEEIALPSWVLIGLSIPMPFLLIAVAPYFYYISIKRLNHLLV